MKRFYKVASLKEESNGFSILLDGKPVKTKTGKILLAPCESIAQEIVLEWAKQGENIMPEDMPFMQILSTKLDRVMQDRKTIESYLLRYVDTDLLYYIADDPLEMKDCQENLWRPWREWLERKIGTNLFTTSGLSALKQNEAVHLYIAESIKNMSDDVFTVFQIATSLSGSIILGLAFASEEAKAEDIFNACTVEERFKAEIYDAEKYGPDPIQEKQHKSIRRDLEAAQKYISML